MAKRKPDLTQVKAKEVKFDKNEAAKPSSSNRALGKRRPGKITKSRLEGLLPKGSKHNISDALLGMVDRMEDDTGLPQEMLEEDVMSYMYILKQAPRTSVEELINAVKFCNLKRNHTNEDAWKIVFPERHDKLIADGKQIANHVSMYNGTKLVQEIDKEMLIPFHIQYAAYQHKAIKKQYDLMNGRAAPNANGEQMSVSPMVQMLASKALLEATKMPETAKIDLTVSKSDEEVSMQQEMNQQLAQLVKMQKARLNAGESIETVQQIGVNFNSNDAIDAEIEEDYSGGGSMGSRN